MSDLINIRTCNISQALGESSRFLFHVFLVHVCTCIVEGKRDFFSEDVFRALVIAALAILMYHVFFRKIIEPKIEKMKLICYKGHDRHKKKKDIQKEYFPDNDDKRDGNVESEDDLDDYQEQTPQGAKKKDREQDRENGRKEKRKNRQNSRKKNRIESSSGFPRGNQEESASFPSGKTAGPRDYSVRQRVLHD